MKRLQGLAKQHRHSFNRLDLFDGLEFKTAAHTLDVCDPASGELLAIVPESTKEDINSALSNAQECHHEFSQNHPLRTQSMRQWGHLMKQHADDLALLIAMEGGKVYRQAKDEVLSAVSGVCAVSEYLEKEFIKDCEQKLSHGRLIYKPLGVCYAITPWNFPISMITRKVAPALAAGCSVILKPDRRTPLTCLLLIKLAYQAGFPSNSIHVILTSNPQWASELILKDPLVVQHVSFTGSTAVGQQLSKLIGARSVCFELGGLSPFIVHRSVDIDVAVDALVSSRFRHSGQTCICANRLILDESIYEKFMAKLKDKICSLRIGHQLEHDTDMGPLVDRQAADHVRKVIEQFPVKWQPVTSALPNLNYVSPTLVFPDTLYDHEIFGPVICVHKFRDPQEAVHLSRSSYGLAAYIYSNDEQFTNHLSRNLTVGLLGVNTIAVVRPDAPFSGCLMSGHGVEGRPQLAIRQCMRPFAILN